MLTSDVIKDANICGMAYFGVAGTDYAVGFGAHSCNKAPGYTFGHEIGHTFGCAHNPEETQNDRDSYGHGALIMPPGKVGNAAAKLA